MEIPVSGLEVVRSTKRDEFIYGEGPDPRVLLGYVLAVNLETGRVTCLTVEGVIWSLVELQQMHSGSSVYVRSSGVAERVYPASKAVVLPGCDEHGHFLPIVGTLIGVTGLTCVCGRLIVHSAGLRTVWEE